MGQQTNPARWGSRSILGAVLAPDHLGVADPRIDIALKQVSRSLLLLACGNVERSEANVGASAGFDPGGAFEAAALPPFVRRELEGYLDCGLLCRG